MTESADQDSSPLVFGSEARKQRRLSALRDYDVLDTPPEEAFDRLTRIARDLFGADVAFVAFLDTDRQWFKSIVGLDRTESSLAASFCTYTIANDGPLVIEDAANDDRTHDSSFVTDEGLRFYAGVPIRASQGEAIGTFSIMAPEPRSLSDEETNRLAELAEMASEALERRREARMHEGTARRFEAILEDPNMLVGVLAPDGTLLEANETSLQYIEESEEEVLGRPFWDTPWWPESMRDEIRSQVDRAAGGEYVEYEADLEGAGGTPYSVQGTIRPVKDGDEKVEALVVSARDVTERKEAEKMLEETRRFHEQVLEQVPIDLAVFDPDAKFKYINPQSVPDPERREWLTGHTNEDYCRKRGLDPSIGRRRDEAIRKTARDGVLTDLEETLPSENGPRHYLRVHGPITDADGQVTHVAGFGLDITERKQREQKTGALYTATEQLLKAQTAVEVAERIETVVRETFEYPLSGVHFVQEGQLVPVCVSPSITERWPNMPARDLKGDGLGARAYRSGETTTAGNLSGFDTPIDYKDLRSGACIPIGGHGVISIGSTEGDDINAFDLRLLEILASDAAAVLDRIEHEQELERQNDLFAKAQEIADVGAWEYDVSTGEHSWTDQVYRIYGLPKSFDPTVEEEISRYHPEDRPTIRDAFTRAVEQGVPYDLELRLISEDGEQRWVRTLGEPQREGGTVVRVRGTIQDITARKKQERDLQRSEERWRSLLEHLRSGVHVSVENKIQYVNPAGADIFGVVDPEDLVGRDSREFVPDDVEVNLEKRLETLNRGDPTEPIEHEIVRADGVRRLIRVYSVPIQIHGKQGRQSVFRDVTERRRREERVRDRGRKIESLYDATKGLLTAKRPEAVFRRIHDVMTTVFDYSLSNTGFVDGEDLVPVDVTTDDSEGVPTPEAEPVDGDSIAARALQTGEPVVVEDVQTIDNHADYGSLQSVAALPIAGHGVIVLGQVDEQQFDPFDLRLLEVLGTYASMVLDRLRGEEALREAKEKAEEASQLKSAMLANMSHEIRTPLTSVTGFAELLKEHLEGQMQTFAEQIYNGGVRLQKTLDSVLQLSRLQAGVYEMERTPLALGSLIEETVDMLRFSAEEKSLCLNVQLPEEPVEGRFNEGAVNRIVENLLENAIKFTPEGGTIDVRAHADGDEVVLEVEDTGVGISEEALPEIFGAFKQESEGLGREYEGSGLGLSIVQRLTEAHGGTVEVDSEKGVGTRFVVRLPRSAPDGG